MFCVNGFNSNELSQVSHDCETEMRATDKVFGEICV